MNHKFGYSLVEILVVMTIMGIGVGLGTIAFTQISQRQSLDKAYRILKSVFFQAREDANQGHKAQSCNTFLGYEVRIDAGLAQIEVEPLCQEGPTGEVRVITLDPGIAIDASPVDEVTFLAVERITNLNEDMDIEINLNGQQQQLTITPTGEIQ